MDPQKEEQPFAKEALGPLQETFGKTKVLGIILNNDRNTLEFELTTLVRSGQ